jgi:hypothetical protein
MVGNNNTFSIGPLSMKSPFMTTIFYLSDIKNVDSMKIDKCFTHTTVVKIIRKPKALMQDRIQKW